jgi:hypothetical protein
MRLSYRREAEPVRRYDRTYNCWRVGHLATYTIRQDGADIGTARVETTTSMFRRYGVMNQGRKWRADWQINLPGRAWTIPGIRTRTEVLAEIKQHLTKEISE